MQAAGWLTGARSMECRMTYRKFSWLEDHDRMTISLAIPMAMLPLPR